MKKVFVLLLFLLVTTLTACDEENFSYKGESDSWSILFNIEKEEDIVKGRYTAKYNGGNLQGLLEKEIKYQINYKSASSGGSTYISTDGIIEGPAFEKSYRTGCSFSEVDYSEIVFVIIIDGKEESIILRKK